MNFQPLKDRIVVERDSVEEKVLDSGIVITKEVQERPQNGTVLAVGSEIKDVKVGDYIMFGKHDGQEHSIEGKIVLIMRENQVWGVINETKTK